MKQIFASVIAIMLPFFAEAQTAKYIFYFIGDGMGPGAVSAAQLYNRVALHSQSPLNMQAMEVASLATTHSASSPVTDSAAAGTALACGTKTRNGMLGQNADTVNVESVASKLQRMGYGIGIVTTVAPDDATPAAFYAHRPNRGMYYEIGLDAASSGFDFIAGGNLRGLKDKSGNPTDLLEVLENNSVSLVRGVENIPSARHKRILLVQNDTSSVILPHAIDSVAGALTLPVITQACLDHLKENAPKSFFMMVEGGTIDYAGHSNDAGTNMVETINFDQSLEVALEWYRQHPKETLIVVTADHETGGLSVGCRHTGYMAHPELVRYQRMSKDSFAKYCRSLVDAESAPSWDEMKNQLSDKLGLYGAVKVSEETDSMLRSTYAAMIELKGQGEVKTLYSSFDKFTQQVFGYLNNAQGYGWTTYNHTGNMVPVYAQGVGAQLFGASMDNTDIPKRILQAATGAKRRK